MAITTSKFLILHEIGHCTNGHVGHSQFSLEEFEKPAREISSEILLRHTFEMDADSFAINSLLREAFFEIETGTVFRWSKHLNNYPPGRLLYPTLIANCPPFSPIC